MPTVKFTSALKRFFPKLVTIQVPGNSVSEVLDHVEEKFPGMKSYLLEDTGKLRKHVNIFIGENLIQDETELSDLIGEKDEIHVFQALSGG